jgi:hypothetical protein
MKRIVESPLVRTFLSLRRTELPIFDTAPREDGSLDPARRSHLDLAFEIAQVVSERSTRLRPAALEIGREPELIAQRRARFDTPRLLGFDVPNADRGGDNFVVPFDRKEQRAVVIGDNDVAVGDEKIAHPRFAERRFRARIEPHRAIGHGTEAEDRELQFALFS